MGQCLKRSTSIAAGTEDIWSLLDLETPTKSTKSLGGAVPDSGRRYRGSGWYLISISQKVAGLTTVAKLEGASPPKFNSRVQTAPSHKIMNMHDRERGGGVTPTSGRACQMESHRMSACCPQTRMFYCCTN